METPLATDLVQPAPGAPLPALRPMSAGELLDRALQLFRTHFARLFIVMLTFQAPMYALFKSVMNQSAAFLRQSAGGQVPEISALLWLLGKLVGFLFLAMTLYQLAVASLTTGAARAYLGEKIEAGTALWEGLKRAPHLVGTFLVLLLWCVFNLGLATLPGLGIAAASFLVPPSGTRLTIIFGGSAVVLVLQVVVMLYLLLRYALVSEVVVIEKRSFVGAMRRSAQLMSGRIGPTFVDNCKIRLSILYAVNFCISLSVLVVTSIPNALVNSAYGVSPFDPERFDPALVPLWASVPVDVLGVLAQSAVAPFGLLAVIVFYFDLRIRKEGFDLELLASRMGNGS
ncbi:MAG: hypothetical protein QM765_00210 [Myxococcales bacterium]